MQVDKFTLHAGMEHVCLFTHIKYSFETTELLIQFQQTLNEPLGCQLPGRLKLNKRNISLLLILPVAVQQMFSQLTFSQIYVFFSLYIQQPEDVQQKCNKMLVLLMW